MSGERYVVAIESTTYPGALATFTGNWFNRTVGHALVYKDFHEAVKELQQLKERAKYKAPEQIGTIFGREEEIQIYTADSWIQRMNKLGITCTFDMHS